MATPIERSQAQQLEIRDVEDVRSLVGHDGPWLSLVLQVPVRGAAEGSLSAKWAPIRDRCARDGASPDLLEAVEQVIADLPPNGRFVAILASPGVVAHCWLDPAVQWSEDVRVGPRPALAPVIESLAVRAVAMGVLLDRAGADVFVYQPDGAELTDEIQGDTDFIHRGAPGGWSQRRFQTRAELTWDRNAAEVAAEVVDRMRATEAQIVVVSGDERARGFLRQHMPSDLVDLVHDVQAGGRNEPDSPARLAGSVRSTLAGAAAAVRRAWYEELAEESGQEDRATTGPEDTLQALTIGAAQVVFVVDDGVADREVYVGRSPGHVATDPATLEAMGDEAQPARLIDAVITAALATGARVVTVPPDEASAVPGGVAAILRYRLSER